MAERKAVTREMAVLYEVTSKKAKGEVLDHLCAITGWSRDHARRALRQVARGSEDAPSQPRRRTPIYGADVLEPLKKVWATLDGPCGKRLAPFMAEIVSAMERAGELKLSPTQRDQLLTMSAATIDRRLAPERRKLRFRAKPTTKPGSMLKSQVPIRTFSDWDDTRPGFVECDLVAHDGGNINGDYCQTLDLTDVATGWTELRAVRSKAQHFVIEAIKEIDQAMPFTLLGIDSDNGGEFINRHLIAYCLERDITFTRARPYRKNDSCFVEQKNWTVVRHATGYLRYDTPEDLAGLNELYRHLHLQVNFFQPQMKLISKARIGAQVKKRYDVARTPYQRILSSEEVSQQTKADLTDLYRTLNPVQLKRDIIRCQDELLKLARHKARNERWRKGVDPKSSRTSSVRQRTGRSRAS